MADDANGPAVDRGRYRVSELSPQHFTSRDDDVLGAMASQAALSEVPWKPDVAPVVTERLARDAVAYPGQFGPSSRTPSMGAPRGAVAGVPAGTAPRGTRRLQGGMAMGLAGLVMVIAVVGISVSTWNRVASGPSGTGASGPSSAPAVALGEPLPTAGEPAVAPAAAVAVADDSIGIDHPALTIVAARPNRDGVLGARVQLEWSPSDVAGPVDRTQLQRKVRSGSWVPIASADTGGSIETTLLPGKRYNFRVRSLDDAGNVITSHRLRAVLAVRDWASARIERTPGDWSTTNGGSRLGGALASTSSDAGIRTDFSGTSVALVAPVGPTGGAMLVRIDDGEWMRGELSDPQPVDHAVVFSRRLEDGDHSLDIAVDEGTIALDSMLFVRTPETWSGRS